MKKLVSEGADVNEPNNRGWTALMYACRYRREEVGDMAIILFFLWSQPKSSHARQIMGSRCLVRP
jgi:hypothetical protein